MHFFSHVVLAVISTEVSSSVFLVNRLKYEIELFNDTVPVDLNAEPILIKRIYCSIRINKRLGILFWAEQPLNAVWWCRTVEDRRIVDHTWDHCDGCIYCNSQNRKQLGFLLCSKREAIKHQRKFFKLMVGLLSHYAATKIQFTQLGGKRCWRRKLN